jgi:hypothetical protein
VPTTAVAQTANYGTIEDVFLSGSGNAISNYGTVIYTHVASNAYINNYAWVIESLVNNGGYLHNYSGGEDNNLTVSGTGELYNYAGGRINNVVVSNGTVFQQTGGVIDGIKLDSGILANGYWQFIGSTNPYFHGGRIDNSTINDGVVYNYIGGEFRNVALKGGTFNNRGGTVSGNVEISGRLNNYSGGTVNNPVINSGGRLYSMESGGTITNATVNAGTFWHQLDTIDKITVNAGTFYNGGWSWVNTPDIIYKGGEIENVEIRGGEARNFGTFNNGVIYDGLLTNSGNATAGIG